MVLYTDADMTATQSNTVAANSRRSFLRKLIASQPRRANHWGARHWVVNLWVANLWIANLLFADQRAGYQPTKDQPAKAPPRSSPPVDPVPSRARVHLPHSPPANGKAG